jgi:hypothetical protein
MSAQIYYRRLVREPVGTGQAPEMCSGLALAGPLGQRQGCSQGSGSDTRAHRAREIFVNV